MKSWMTDGGRILELWNQCLYLIPSSTLPSALTPTTQPSDTKTNRILSSHSVHPAHRTSKPALQRSVSIRRRRSTQQRPAFTIEHRSSEHQPVNRVDSKHVRIPSLSEAALTRDTLFTAAAAIGPFFYCKGGRTEPCSKQGQ